jgi:hypothetical protein
MLIQVYQLPSIIYVVVLVMAAVTQSLYQVGEQILDKIIYKREISDLRNSLRKLGLFATVRGDLPEILTPSLHLICSTMRATYGLLLVEEGESLTQMSSYLWSYERVTLPKQEAVADDVLHLTPGYFPSPLSEAALLVPLFVESEQIGALILGRPVNGLKYSDRDVETLLDPSDRLSSAIWHAKIEQDHINQITKLARNHQPIPSLIPEKISVSVVEKAFRNLKDYAFLGDSSLANLKLVRSRLAKGVAVTHVDRGKLVCTLITDALEKLRPVGKEPGDLAPREWHPYLVLHDAYIKDRLNRDIMSRLYISEGTFNRTRRSALRSVARILGDMEKGIQ